MPTDNRPPRTPREVAEDVAREDRIHIVGRAARILRYKRWDGSWRTDMKEAFDARLADAIERGINEYVEGNK